MEKTTKTDNLLIAEFMGEPIHAVTSDGKTVFIKPPSAGLKPFEARYETSWDWLMPAVDKIVKLFDEAFPPGEDFAELILARKEPIEKEYMDVVGLPIGTPIQEVYQAVVTFIKWHNEK